MPENSRSTNGDVRNNRLPAGAGETARYNGASPYNATSKLPGFILLVIALAAALAISFPYMFTGQSSRIEYLARKNAESLSLALDRYAATNGGDYPPDELITGGTDGDVLTEARLIRKYPQNPFGEPGINIKKVPFDNPSPGDFSYRRDPARHFEYEFVVYGKHGIVFEHISHN